MQIVSASLSLDSSYQLDLKSASVTASTTAPANPASAPPAATAPPAPPPSDSYLASPQTPVRHGHGRGHGHGHGHRSNSWISQLEDKLENGDVAGAQQQIGQVLARIVQQLEKSGNAALKQVTQSNQASASDATASGSAVQFHDEAKVALSLSFQTSDGQQFGIEAAIDVSRTLARQQVSVPQAA